MSVKYKKSSNSIIQLSSIADSLNNLIVLNRHIGKKIDNNIQNNKPTSPRKHNVIHSKHRRHRYRSGDSRTFFPSFHFHQIKTQRHRSKQFKCCTILLSIPTTTWFETKKIVTFRQRCHDYHIFAASSKICFNWWPMWR